MSPSKHFHRSCFSASAEGTRAPQLKTPFMTMSLSSLADLWIGRRSRPRPEALAAVATRTPAVAVTGASRGIGRAVARRFARAGRTIVLIARNGDALAEAASDIAHSTGAQTVSVPLDATRPDAGPAIDAALAAHGLYLDILVNNAGVGLSGAFEDQSAEAIDALLALNVAAVTRLMHHALGPMLARGRGGILNLGSLGGLVPGPYQAVYYASKAYVVSLTEAVAYEVRGRGVRVAVIAPGPVDTEFHARMGAERALYRSLVPPLVPETVAASAYRGFELGQTVIVPGLLPSAGAFALKILPHLVSVPLVAALLSPWDRRAARPPDRP